MKWKQLFTSTVKQTKTYPVSEPVPFPVKLNYSGNSPAEAYTHIGTMGGRTYVSMDHGISIGSAGVGYVQESGTSSASNPFDNNYGAYIQGEPIERPLLYDMINEKYPIELLRIHWWHLPHESREKILMTRKLPPEFMKEVWVSLPP